MGDHVVEPSVPPTETKLEAGNSRMDEDVKCTVCMGSEFTQECRISGCKHSFCFSCISEWVCSAVRPSCPMCRKDIDKVSYDFSHEDDEEGRIAIFIKEYRTSQMSLSPMERAQMMGERRLVVRNLVYAYKLKSQLTSAIEEHEAASKDNECLKTSLVKLVDDVTVHLGKAELLLAGLRTDAVHNDKAIVCNTEPFRRMVYTLKIKVKYPDLRRPKLLASDIAQDPERFRGFVTQFLVSEFESIPTQTQPNTGGFKWRTNFLGGAIDEAKKKEFANQIYELMLVARPGNEMFQKMIAEVLTNVDPNHITILDDHLEAILSVESTNYNDFYNKIYYDSVYNSLSSNFELQGMMNAMRAMREGEHMPTPFEAFFNRMRDDHWVSADHFLDERLLRQMSNTDRTDRTDRATNNDDMSDRSGSPPEERVPTPMPEDEMEGRPSFLSHPDVEESLNLYRLFASAVDDTAAAAAGTQSPEAAQQAAARREERQRRSDQFARRVRELNARSEMIASMFHPPPVIGDPNDPTARRRLITLSTATNSTNATTTTIPVYMPSTVPPANVVPPPHMRLSYPAIRLDIQRELDQMAELLNAGTRANAALNPNAPRWTPPQPVLSQAGQNRLQEFIEERMRDTRSDFPPVSETGEPVQASMRSRLNSNGSTTVNYRIGNVNASLTTRLPASFYSTEENVPVPHIRIARAASSYPRRNPNETPRDPSDRYFSRDWHQRDVDSPTTSRLRTRPPPGSVRMRSSSRRPPRPASSSSREADRESNQDSSDPDPDIESSPPLFIAPSSRRRRAASPAETARTRPRSPYVSSRRAGTSGSAARRERERRNIADIAASIDRADEAAGLDFISVAHRTRAARRAAANGQLPGAPAVKRANSRRD